MAVMRNRPLRNSMYHALGLLRPAKRVYDDRTLAKDGLFYEYSTTGNK